MNDSTRPMNFEVSPNGEIDNSSTHGEFTGTEIRNSEWRETYTDHLEYRDVKILNDRSIFEVLDAKRKTSQAKKDFINDQDSVIGPGVVDNIIRNILTVPAGTIKSDIHFGFKIDGVVFETLDWSAIEFLRSAMINALNNIGPSNVNVTEVQITADETLSTLDIAVAYNIRLSEDSQIWQEPGPETIGDRKFNVTLNLAGIRGSN